MHRFFADENGIVNGTACLNIEDSQHALRVLRLGSGDEIELVCAPGRYLAQIAGEPAVLEYARHGNCPLFGSAPNHALVS